MVDTIIVSGGNIQKDFALDFLRGTMKRAGNTVRLVAADRGLEFFEDTDYTPDLIIGDFDSLSDKGKNFYDVFAAEKKNTVEIIRLKPEKDDSDTQAAVNASVERGAKNILILGATGNRMDHFMANLGLLLLGEKNNIRISLVDAYNYICLVKSGTVLKKAEQFGKYISFFPLDGDVTALTLNGFRYPLKNHTLKASDSGLTVSNELWKEEGTITYEKGTLVMIMSRD